jgi:hypothetical protein
MTTVNDNSRVITKLETSLTDNAKVIIYDHHMFIVQATGKHWPHACPRMHPFPSLHLTHKLWNPAKKKHSCLFQEWKVCCGPGFWILSLNKLDIKILVIMTLGINTLFIMTLELMTLSRKYESIKDVVTMITGLFYKTITIVNDDCKWCYNLEHHLRS